MGSGKTYEVVSEVIFNALLRGRRVVSNIAGLNYDAYCAIFSEQGVSPDRIGQLVQVSHDDVLDPIFWRTDKDVQEGIESFIQPGDLLALDENWRFWDGFGSKTPERVMNFFRMHRHFTHPVTGVACDVALISQDVMDFSRKVRAVIEETYRMEKLTAIGSTKRYRVDVYSGSKITRKPLRQLQRIYDPRFFSLYSSHSQKKEGDADAKEVNIDERGNILKGPLFRIGLPVSVLFFLLSFYGLYRFFHKQSEVDSSVDGSPVSTAQPLNVPVVDRPSVNEDWRSLGYYQRGNSIIIAIQNSSGFIRYLVDPPIYKITPAGVEVELPEGGFATPWTNIKQSNGLL